MSGEQEEYGVSPEKYVSPLTDALKQALIAAGWLPPCEGRKAWSGKVTRKGDGWNDFKCLGEEMVGDVLDRLLPPEGQRIRLILDPLPEEAKGDAR